MNKVFLTKLVSIIESNYSDELFGSKELSKKVGVSRSQLHRKLHVLTKKSTSQYIREYRLEKALLQLQDNTATVSEISYSVGFNSPSYFNTSFNNYFGYPPGEVKFRKTAVNEEPAILEPKKSSVGHYIPQPDKQKKKPKILIYSLLGVALLLLIFGVAVANKETSKEKIGISTFNLNNKSIAVLPFKNLSDQNENQYFADGVMEVILNKLSSIKELRVISRTSIEQYRESTKTVPEIAEDLNVTYILEASVQKDKGQIRIIAQLIDARNDQHIWSTDIKRDYKDIFDLQTGIANQIVSEMNPNITDQERNQIEKRPTDNLEAYTLYLKGRYFKNRWNLDKSQSYLERAIEKDPGFSLAYSALANVYTVKMYFGNMAVNQNINMVRDLAKKAIALNPNLAEPHTTYASILHLFDWNWATSEKEFLMGIKLNPNDATMRIYYSKLLRVMGRFEEARKQTEQAQSIDLLSVMCNYYSAELYYHLGDLKKALEESNKIIELNKNDIGTRRLNFDIYLEQQRYDDAVQELQYIMKLNSKTEIHSKEIQHIYTESGIKGVYSWLIDFDLSNKEDNYNKPFYLAQKFAFIGEEDKALSMLEKAMELHISKMTLINRYPCFKNLRSHPRFKSILHKMGLDNFSDL